jgi:hypothetical protein
MRHLFIAVFLAAATPLLVPGCGEPTQQVRSRKVTAGCGTCQFRLVNGVGCYWTIELDGKLYPVTGSIPKDHAMHSPDGMCNMKRTAIVDGEISGTTFIASRFDLQPAEAPADAPMFTESDDHDGSWDASQLAP